MNAISNALYKRKMQKQRNLADLSMDSAIEWVMSITFLKLHDRYGFGRHRFQKMLSIWNEVQETTDENLVRGWRREVVDHGFDDRINIEFGKRIQKLITGNKKDKYLIAHTRDLAAGTVIIIMHALINDHGWRKKRIRDLQEYLKDDSYALKNGEITIWEIMKVLQRECDVKSELLEYYERDYGEVIAGNY